MARVAALSVRSWLFRALDFSAREISLTMFSISLSLWKNEIFCIVIGMKEVLETFFSGLGTELIIFVLGAFIGGGAGYFIGYKHEDKIKQVQKGKDNVCQVQIGKNSKEQ